MSSARDPTASDDPQDPPRKKTRRAGQACDRCRSRKIKCDGKLPSCNPCEIANVICNATDRTSNRTIQRGYLEVLESKLAEQNRLQARINELEARLRRLDSPGKSLDKPDTTQNFHTSPETSNSQPPPSTDVSRTVNLTRSQSQSFRDPEYADASSAADSVYRSLNTQGDQDTNTDPGVFEAGDTGKGWYLGSASGMIYMNSIKNTASSVLGIELDLSELSPLSKSASGKSGTSLLFELYSHRSRKPSKLLLPPMDMGFELVNDFFATINLLCPFLHRPSFYRDLKHCYDDSAYIPSSAFIVQFNLVMAIAARVRPISQPNCLGASSSHLPLTSAQTNKHKPTLAEITPRQPPQISHDQFYSRVLPYFPDLLLEPELSDLQALLLLMMYLIGIYKMGHLWHLSRVISAVVYELGLHRSDTNWSNFNPLEREMRKRVYFLAVGLDLRIANSLGRPPGFRLQDSDVSLPAYMDDEYIDETGSKPMPEGHIPQLAPAMELAMLIRISCSVTEKLFSVSKGRRQRGRYVDVVLELEKELLDWKDRAPDYIKFDITVPPDQSPFWIANAVLFLKYNELRLLIRHPSMGRLSPSPDFFAESLSICAEASRNILAIINRFRDFRQLDCHPQSVSTIVLAGLTILYSLWEKKSEASKHEIEREMKVPLDMLYDIGQTSGSTHKLYHTLANLVAATIENLEQSRNASNTCGASFNSPTQALAPPPMQLPMRIDASLHFERTNRENATRYPVPYPPTDSHQVMAIRPLEAHTFVPLRWQDPANRLNPPVSDARSHSSTTPSSMITNQELGRSEVFDDSMLWGPSLEWTGSWDDFLNTIAM